MMVGTNPEERPEMPIRILSSAWAEKRNDRTKITIEVQTKILNGFIQTSSPTSRRTEATFCLTGGSYSRAFRRSYRRFRRRRFLCAVVIYSAEVDRKSTRLNSSHV